MSSKILLCLMLGVLLTAGSAAAEPRPLTLWIHPYLPATELITRFTPLAEYLSQELEREIEVRVQQNYQSHIDLVGRDLADIAYLGPASYVQITDQYGAKPLLAKLEVDRSAYFHGMVVVRHDSPLRELAGLQGKSFAFGDPNSTMSHIVPRAMLKRAGITLEHLARYDFLGSHHDVALAVLGGYFEAGAVKQEVFAMYQKRGLRMLAESPPIANHLLLTRADLPPELIARIREALLAINQLPGKEELLTAIEDATGMLPVNDQEYDELRRMMDLQS